MLKRHASADHEQLFVERYGRLSAVALRLTGGQRDRADELVQDAFIQFTLTTPNLEEVRNLDAYLHGVLRKLHLSRARRAARAPEVPLTAIDYDSVELSLSRADARAHRHVLSELGAVCAYACQRKQSSKAASVLILRFFHGYYPDEIARILRIDVRAVDEWRRIARREANVALSKHAHAGAHAPADTIADLRGAIFASCSGPCLTPAQLSAYGAAPLRQRLGKVLSLPGQTTRMKSDVDCAMAAHIVSCERCLNEISRRVGIPSLSERSAEDNLGPGSRQDPPEGSDGAAPASDAVHRARRRGKQTFEHKPEQLHIAVNGLPLVWQSIGTEPIDQHVNVTTHESIEFVEVFSEQGVRLLFLNVRPPADDTPVQSVQAALSGGRTIAVQLSYAGTWPSIHLRYDDPAGIDQPDVAETIAGEPRSPAVADDSGDRAGWRHRWRLVFAVALAIGVSAVASATPRSMLVRALREIDRVVHEWINTERTELPALLDARAVPSTMLAEAKRPVASAFRRRAATPAELPALAFADLAALEIEALRRLDRIDALLGERITVSRDSRRVRIDGIAETPARKTEIVAALGPLMTTSGVAVTLHSVAERLGAGPRATRESLTLLEVHVAHDAFPAREAVLGYVQSHGEQDATRTIEERARDFASQVIRRSDEALVHTWAVQRLAARFTVEEQRALTAEVYASWWSLVAEHARHVREATAALRQDLRPIFGPALPDIDAPLAIDETAESSVHIVIDRLGTLVSAYDRAIRTAFTAREETAGSGRDASAVDDALLQSMREAERLADWLARRSRS